MNNPIIADKSYQATIINPECPAGDLQEAIGMKIDEIRAMALVASEEGFATWHEGIRESYLNLVSRQAQELEALFKAFIGKVDLKKSV